MSKSKTTEQMDLVKAMHTKFGISGGNVPHKLEDDERKFRITAMQEELDEYRDAKTLEDEFDALLDLKVFVDGTLERQGMSDIELEGYRRIMTANLAKELGGNAKRGNFQIDLVKPKGWIAPDHSDLIEHGGNLTGLIVIDGPDAAGKSTLCDFFVDTCGAHYKHLTWSPDLEKHMDSYQIGALAECLEIAKTQLVVLDRCWLSELVYSNIYRNGSAYPELAKTCFDMLKGSLNIVALPTYRDWIENFKRMSNEREEMYAGDIQGMRQIYDQYEGVYNGLFVAHSHPFVDGEIKKGLCMQDNFVSYNMYTDGKNVPAYALKVLSRLYKIK